MKRSARWVRRLIVAIIGGLLTALCVTAPAMAQPCTGLNCGVSGTVTLVTSTTMALNNTTFSIQGSPGQGVSAGGTGTTNVPGAPSLYTVPAAYPVTATITTNAGSYSIDETLADNGSDGIAGFEAGDYFLGSAANGGTALTYAWTYPANGGPSSAGSFGESWSTAQSGNALASPVVSQNTNSAASGDSYGLSWGWNVPLGQPTSTPYTGTISVIGI